MRIDANRVLEPAVGLAVTGVLVAGLTAFGVLALSYLVYKKVVRKLEEEP